MHAQILLNIRCLLVTSIIIETYINIFTDSYFKVHVYDGDVKGVITVGT